LAHRLMRIGVKNLKVALAHYLPSGGLDDIVAAAGPADLEIVKIDVTAPAEAQCETIKDADALFFVFGGQMPDAVVKPPVYVPLRCRVSGTGGRIPSAWCGRM
jgi:hypothetical protein